MKKYSQKLGNNNDKWWPIGDSDEHFAPADDYFITAYADPDLGGFDHSGQILLIDKSSHIRSPPILLGTDPESTQKSY
ncbi:MAG: hypothetical protein R2766_09525 [Saprospiraceae bacterium]